MELSTYLLSATVLWLGYVNWKHASKIIELQEQNDIQHNLILNMAKELQSLGSPNVALAEPPPLYEIRYENKE